MTSPRHRYKCSKKKKEYHVACNVHGVVKRWQKKKKKKKKKSEKLVGAQNSVEYFRMGVLGRKKSAFEEPTAMRAAVGSSCVWDGDGPVLGVVNVAEVITIKFGNKKN